MDLETMEDHISQNLSIHQIKFCQNVKSNEKKLHVEQI